jgi:hypothetical protein
VKRSIRSARALTLTTRDGLCPRTTANQRDLVAPSIALVAILCLVAGCTAASSRSPGPTPQAGSPSTGVAGSLQPASAQPSQEPVASPGPVGLPASVVDPVVADIARLAGVPVDQVVVQSAEAVTFPDGGLGCPVPGMAYPQVQVDGYKIVAVAGGTTYDYRGTAPGTFRLCTPQK